MHVSVCALRGVAIRTCRILTIQNVKYKIKKKLFDNNSLPSGRVHKFISMLFTKKKEKYYNEIWKKNRTKRLFCRFVCSCNTSAKWSIENFQRKQTERRKKEREKETKLICAQGVNLNSNQKIVFGLCVCVCVYAVLNSSSPFRIYKKKNKKCVVNDDNDMMTKRQMAKPLLNLFHSRSVCRSMLFPTFAIFLRGLKCV